MVAKKLNVIPEPEAPRTILDEAKDLVYGARATVYGHPADNFRTTAAMWTAFLQHRVMRGGTSLEEFVFTPEDVAMFMVLAKTARLANTPGHWDSIVDLAGYAATAGRCLEVEG